MIVLIKIIKIVAYLPECDVLVSKLFHSFGGFEFGIGKIWYRKKYRIRYRKYLVLEKVSDSVSEEFGIGKKFCIRFRSDFGYRQSSHTDLKSSVIREAILQKIPFFYEILSQTGRGGQPDFISLIQKLSSLSNHPFFKDPLI